MLSFQNITLDLKPIIDDYYVKYGEGSCQHSFVSSFCLEAKYEDKFAFSDDYMFIERRGQNTNKEIMMLFPMGNKNDEHKLKKAIDEIFNYVNTLGKKVCFNTITEYNRDILVRLYPNKFDIEENRNYFEYIYSYDTLANLPGTELSSKRYDLRTFERDYGTRFREKIIEKNDIDDILKFQQWWLEEKLHGDEDVQLTLENEDIKIGLANFDKLNLNGIITYIDGKMVGYAYGCPLSDEYFDVLIEKGNRAFPDIYKVLNRDLVRLCCKKYKYINREEDCGVPGLRKAKMSYKPDMMIKKYIVREK